jgi:hypothetical protein
MRLNPNRTSCPAASRSADFPVSDLSRIDQTQERKE